MSPYVFSQIGQLLVTIAILGFYGAHALGLGGTWSDGDNQLMNVCLTLVIGYWLGSSSGSAKKTDALLKDEAKK